MLQALTSDERSSAPPHTFRRHDDSAALESSPDHDSALWGETALAARVRQLIAKHDDGDVCAAARRLGVPVATLVRLEETLAACRHCAADRADADMILIGALRGYGVTAAWLLTGCEDPELTAIPHAVNDRMRYILVAAAEQVAAEHLEHHTGTRRAAGMVTTPAAAGAASR